LLDSTVWSSTSLEVPTHLSLGCFNLLVDHLYCLIVTGGHQEEWFIFRLRETQCRVVLFMTGLVSRSVKLLVRRHIENLLKQRVLSSK
jgi:hypothetical protein